MALTIYKRLDGMPTSLITESYEIYDENGTLIIDNNLTYDSWQGVSLDKKHQVVVLFALAEMLGYDLIKKGE